MNNDWKQFLAESGASLGQDDVFRFNGEHHSDLAEGGFICDLSHFSTVVIAGPEATDFMQGQFTNDVSAVDDCHSQLSAFCNKKGRMVANFRLFQYQQNYFLSVRSELVERSIEHLQHYVLSAQVAIQDVSEQLVHIGISGDDAETILSTYITELNGDIDSVSKNDDYIAIRIAGDKPRFEIFCAADKARTLWQDAASKLAVANGDTWNYLHIRSGLPFIDMATSEEFVPQMANMELINGVSFTKGCYTGQEIVARTHYLGKQKRRTFRIRIESQQPPLPGDLLATDTSTDSQYIGTIINVYQVSDGEFEALAVIQMAATDARLQLKGVDSRITILDLPYSLEADSTS